MDSKSKQRSLSIYGAAENDSEEDLNKNVPKQQHLSPKHAITNAYNSVLLRYNKVLLNFSLLRQRAYNFAQYATTTEGIVKLSIISGSAVVGAALAAESKSTFRLYKRCIPLATVGCASSVCYPADAILVGKYAVQKSIDVTHKTVNNTKDAYEFTKRSAIKIHSTGSNIYSTVSEFSKRFSSKSETGLSLNTENGSSLQPPGNCDGHLSEEDLSESYSAYNSDIFITNFINSEADSANSENLNNAEGADMSPDSTSKKVTESLPVECVEPSIINPDMPVSTEEIIKALDNHEGTAEINSIESATLAENTEINLVPLESDDDSTLSTEESLEPQQLDESTKSEFDDDMDSQESPGHEPIENEANGIEPLLEKYIGQTELEQPSVVNETELEQPSVVNEIVVEESESPIEDSTALEESQKADEAIVEESHTQDEVAAVPDVISEDASQDITPSSLEDDKDPLASDQSEEDENSSGVSKESLALDYGQGIEEDKDMYTTRV